MIIHRTILKELFKNLSVIVFSLSVILFMEKFVKLTRLFMGKGADLIDILKIFVYLQPSILLLSIPMAILIATFLTYGRMAADSELVVLKGSGMSFRGISKAAITLSVWCVIILVFISLYLLPRSMHSFKNTLYETIVKKASMTFEAGTFSDVFKDTMIFIKEMPSEDLFRGIFIYRDDDSSAGGPVVIVAEKGVISSNPEEGLIKLKMNNGLIHTYKEDSSSEIEFAEYDFVLTSGIETMEKAKPVEIKTLDLWKGRKKNVSWAIELNRRVALPFACLIFGILGPALSNKIGKIGRLGGFSLSLSILTFYYIFLIMAEGLAKSGKISPFLGGWFPNIVFSAVAAFFFYIAYKDKPIKRL
ncbi:MAG TPA: YjgP/YjgQ family permease [Nitrospirae bacterium]|nr:YjgP/YjgQ family permease [Nitrospirota bacterium]